MQNTLQKGSAAIAIIIIVIILAIGGVYFWKNKLSKNPTLNKDAENKTAPVDNATLEKEFNASAEANIEAELQAIDNELK